MQIQMRKAESLEPEAIDAFLRASEAIEFTGQDRKEVYGWVKATLIKQEYFKQSKKRRGMIRAYLHKVTGLSLPQITRLIRRYHQTGEIEYRAGRRRRFASQYTAADIALLAAVDRAHGRLSGPATRRILEREYHEYGKPEFARLAGISVSHLYNLRRSAVYRRQAVFLPTRPAAIRIGERRKPDPRGEPGHLRVDSVHPGDWEGAKGVYHINAVDEVTQWEVVGCAEGISERFQRFGVRERPGGGAVEQAADRVHAVAAKPEPRQRAGGRQERGGGAETHQGMGTFPAGTLSGCTGSMRRTSIRT
jgi:hypothetical protein